jgi:hypothetical protein
MRNIIVLLKVITIFVLQAVEHCVYGIYNKILYELFTLRAKLDMATGTPELYLEFCLRMELRMR